MFPRQRIDGDIFSEKQLDDEFDGEPDEDLLLTADTITDEQIRKLRASTDADDWRTRRECDYALFVHDWQVRASGRRSCAEILNARRSAK